MTNTFDWRSRIIGLDRKSADQFTHNPKNPKFHPQNQRETLRGIIGEVGQIAPVIENIRTGYLLDGHERVWLALETNAEVDYIKVDVSEEEEAYILATLDPVGMMAQHDRQQLETLLRDVNTGDAAVMEMLSNLATQNGIVDLPDDWKEYDETVADDVEYCTCPNCGHKFPK